MRTGSFNGLLAVVFIAISFISMQAALHDGSSSALSDSDPLTSDNPDFDFGTLSQGVTANATYKLTNRSDKTVLISKVQGSCSCTSHTLPKAKLEPGETVDLSLEFSSGSRRGEANTTLDVYYFLKGERQLRSLQVSAAATVEPDVLFDPAELRFTRGKNDAQVVTIFPGRLEHLQISEVYCTHRAFEAKLEDRTGEKRRRITVQFDASNWSNIRHDAFLEIRTNSTAQPILRVPLVVQKDS